MNIFETFAQFHLETTSKNSHRFISHTKPIDRHLRKRANSSERNGTQIVFHTRKTHKHTKSNSVCTYIRRRPTYMWLRQNFTSNKQSLCAINRFTPGNNYFEQYLHYVRDIQERKAPSSSSRDPSTTTKSPSDVASWPWTRGCKSKSLVLRSGTFVSGHHNCGFILRSELG